MAKRVSWALIDDIRLCGLSKRSSFKREEVYEVKQQDSQQKQCEKPPRPILVLKKRSVSLPEYMDVDGFLAWRRGSRVHDTMVVELLSSKPVRGFLVDITGVLYNSSAGTDGIVIPGSVEAVKRLYKHGHVRFLSNESTNTNENVVARLGRLGYDIKLKDVITPAPVAADYLRKHGLRPFVLVSQGISSYFSAMDQTEPNCILMGDAEHAFTYTNVNQAFRILMKMKDPLLVSLGNGRFYQRTDGPCLDVGAFAAALRFSTNCRQVVVGKPEREYFFSALNSLGLEPDEVVMIGDDIVSDVGGAQSHGIRGVQVRTGKWRPEWESHEVRPWLIADSLKQAVDSILGPD